MPAELKRTIAARSVNASVNPSASPITPSMGRSDGVASNATRNTWVCSLNPRIAQPPPAVEVEQSESASPSPVPSADSAPPQLEPPNMAQAAVTLPNHQHERRNISYLVALDSCSAMRGPKPRCAAFRARRVAKSLWRPGRSSGFQRSNSDGSLDIRALSDAAAFSLRLQRREARTRRALLAASVLRASTGRG